MCAAHHAFCRNCGKAGHGPFDSNNCPFRRAAYNKDALTKLLDKSEPWSGQQLKDAAVAKGNPAAMVEKWKAQRDEKGKSKAITVTIDDDDDMYATDD